MPAVVGVVGLGIMGGAMARSLVTAGWHVFGFDTDHHRQMELIPDGIQVVGSIGELGQKVDTIITSLPTPGAVHSTMVPLAAATTRKTIIETSTLSLEDKLSVKKAMDNARHIVLDCPISGTGAQALTRDLVVYASGDSDTIVALRPLFLAFARRVYDTGEFGNGSRMKIVANLLVAIHNVAAAEAMVLATKSGLDLRKVVELISAGAGTSRVFEQRAPLMAAGHYEPATMKLSVWQKDLGIISEFARDINSPVPLFTATLPLYAAAIENGHQDYDTASVCTVLEYMAGIHRGSETSKYSIP
jgi:putative dehydrogenase